MAELAMDGDLISPGAWSWWEDRRLRYNVSLGLAGWAAYGLTLALHYAFGQPMFATWQSAASVTLLLGAGFLVLMGFANIFYLLGATVESMVAPRDRDAFRKAAFALGYWGSLALPFLFPLVNLAALISLGPGD